MRTATWILSALLLTVCAGDSLAATADRYPEVARRIQQLERIEPNYYFDMHGNAHEHLEWLMIARFDATSDITRAIDRMARDKRRARLVDALYGVLGFVKDPASVPWLKTKVDDPRFFSRWLEQWRNTFDGYGTWEWLDGRERWIELFVSRFTTEANETRRVRLLEVLAGFDDASVVSLFERLSRTTIGHREALVVAAYARVHGLSVDAKRITQAVEVLAHDGANHQMLREMAYQLRDAAFVPFLISIVDRRPGTSAGGDMWSPQDALQKITFETRVMQKSEWEQWFARHGDAGREAWLRLAQDAFRRLVQQDEDGAAAFFEKAVYNWNDIAWLSFVERNLVHRPRFRNDVAGWINLTYRPAYRSRLEALAGKLAPHAASLAPWSRELLVDRGFLGGRQRGTWTEYVRMANSAI